MSEALKKSAGDVPGGEGKSKRHLLILGAILVLTFLLRFYGSWLPFLDDEPDIVVLAKTISITPGHLHLPIHGTQHGPLVLYLIRLGSLIAPGETFRFRLSYLLLGTFHILLIYRLAREALSVAGAIFAALFLGTCEVHILFTKYVTEELPTLFLVTLWFLVLWQGLRRDSRRLVLLSGVILGLGLLAKYTIAFLVPTAFVFLLISGEYRHWLKRKEIYLSFLIALLVTSPNIYWNWRHNWFDFKGGAHYLAPLSLSGFAAELFFGWFTHHLSATDIVYGYDYMGPVAGGLAAMGILLAFGEARREFIKLMVVALWMVMGASFLFAGGLPRHYAVAIIPASVLTGLFLGTLWEKGLAVRILILLIFLTATIFSAKATADFNHYWVSQSSIRLSAWGEDGEIDLTTLSKAFIHLAQKYKATLAVFPARGLDSTGAYFTAYSNIPCISTHVFLRWLEYREEDLERIVFFFRPRERVRKFRGWAEANDYLLSPVIHDEITVKPEHENVTHRLPVRILIMTRKDYERKPDIESLTQLVYGE